MPEPTRPRRDRQPERTIGRSDKGQGGGGQDLGGGAGQEQRAVVQLLVAQTTGKSLPNPS